MNTPTKITIVRICLVPIFATLFLIDAIPYGKFIALFVFVLASASDWLDGYLARKNNCVTDLGKFLDPIADKFLVCTALILLILTPPAGSSFAMYCAIITVVIIARDLVINCLRSIAATKGVVIGANKSGKLKTVLQMIGIILLIPYTNIVLLSEKVANIIYYVGFAVLCLSAVVAIVSMVEYIVKSREVLK